MSYVQSKRLARACFAVVLRAVKLSLLEACAESLCTVLDAYPEFAEHLAWCRLRRRVQREMRNVQNVGEWN